MVKKQLSDAAKGRALGLIEDAGWSITDVANTLGVSRWTIMRLIERRKQNPGSEIPVRKKGTGPKKKWVPLSGLIFISDKLRAKIANAKKTVSVH